MTTVDTSLVILVIILSSALAIFLILAIILAVKLIQISDYIKKFMIKADEIADHAESVAAFFDKSTGPASVGRLLGNIREAVKSKKKRGRDDE